MRGDCNICINGKLPYYSASCAECGLLRKNYKPMTHYDLLISKMPEELAEELLNVFAAFYDVEWSKEMVLEWLKTPVEDEDNG